MNIGLPRAHRITVYRYTLPQRTAQKMNFDVKIKVIRWDKVIEDWGSERLMTLKYRRRSLSSASSVCANIVAVCLCVMESSLDNGELLVSLCYKPHLERLTVGIFEGRNLNKLDTYSPPGKQSISYSAYIYRVEWVSRFLTAHQHIKLYSVIHVGSRWKMQDRTEDT